MIEENKPAEKKVSYQRTGGDWFEHVNNNNNNATTANKNMNGTKAPAPARPMSAGMFCFFFLIIVQYHKYNELLSCNFYLWQICNSP